MEKLMQDILQELKVTNENLEKIAKELNGIAICCSDTAYTLDKLDSIESALNGIFASKYL